MQETLSFLYPIMPFLVTGIAILISITTHEFAHGFAAFLQGDNTAKDAGRLTLNPIAHIDPVGTILLPLMLFLTQSPVFGWARPVPYNPYNLKNLRYGSLLVGLAGPLANLILFLIAALVLKVTIPVFSDQNFLAIFLSKLVVVNFVLMLFNLIPIPPLDGSKILFGLLPARYEHWERQLELYGIYILLAVLFIDYTVFPFIRYFISFAFLVVSSVLGIQIR